ncbi:Ninjurin C-like protein [Daphnia magna]|uniref:Ninjurin C-like protein n=1 Tax=Daphnia magna TaxID=35525 RepID=A0A164SKV6_9CRUS|nr:Ninjurin C-like protein [Daphnia magna]
MNALPQIKTKPFNGDSKKWQTFIFSFRDMIHKVVPSDAQRHALLKLLLSTEFRSYIAKFLDNPSTYYDALVELKKQYGQPQVVARSHLMALMNVPSIRDDDSEPLAKLNGTLHGAMHALRTGGYEQDLESGMTLKHVVSRLPPRMRSSWNLKGYRMTPTRATLKDLAKWIDEMVMGELMTRPSTHRSPSPQKEKEAGGAKSSTKPTPLFGKGPVVFHTSTSLPGKKPQPSNLSEGHSSFPSPKKSVLKKYLNCDNAHSIKACSTFRDLDVTARVECKGANGFNKPKFSSTVPNRGPKSTDPEPNRSAQHGNGGMPKESLAKTKKSCAANSITYNLPRKAKGKSSENVEPIIPDISEATVEATCSVNLVHNGVEPVPENISTEAVNQIIANELTSNFGFHSGDSTNTTSPNAEIEGVIDQVAASWDMNLTPKTGMLLGILLIHSFQKYPTQTYRNRNLLQSLARLKKVQKTRLLVFQITEKGSLGCGTISNLTSWQIRTFASFVVSDVSFLGNYDALDPVRKDECLSLTHLKGPHLGENLFETFIEVVEKDFGLLHKIMSVTTDSASSNFSFMRLLSDFYVSKNIHHINRTGSRISCFAHILNLAVQSFLKQPLEDLELEDDAEFENEDMVASNNIIEKLRRLVNSIRSSGQRRELFEASCEDVNVDPLQLIIDCPTRFKQEYFRQAGWPKRKMNEMREKAQSLWLSVYKPIPQRSTYLAKDTVKESSIADLLWSVCSSETFLPLQDEENNNSDEFQLYLKEPIVQARGFTDIINWWQSQNRKYPNLSEMAMDILAKPETSVPVEREFSLADIITPNRANLNPATIETLHELKGYLKFCGEKLLKLTNIKNYMYTSDHFFVVKSRFGSVGTQKHASAVCRSNKPLLAVQKLCYSVQESPTEALLLRQIEKLWETENFPIVTPAQPLESAKDKMARKKLEAAIQFDGTKYEVGLPWISDDIGKTLDAKKYATKKTIAQGMLDIALLTANASQLKYVLQLRGFVIQAESLLNGRPLTYNSPNTEDDVIEDKKLHPRKHWEAMQVMTTHFWRRWLQEYLSILTDRRKWLFDKKNFAVDNTVLVLAPNSPTGH